MDDLIVRPKSKRRRRAWRALITIACRKRLEEEARKASEVRPDETPAPPAAQPAQGTTAPVSAQVHHENPSPTRPPGYLSWEQLEEVARLKRLQAEEDRRILAECDRQGAAIRRRDLEQRARVAADGQPQDNTELFRFRFP